MSPPELVVGAGISGVACARALQDAGRPVVVRERDRVGGRASSTDLGERKVEVGAAYFTASVPVFTDLVSRWIDEGLALPWTDTFHVATPDGIVGTRTGPMRYTAPRGLSSLADDQADGLDVRLNAPVMNVGAGTVDDEQYRGVALAVPSPVALELLDASLDAERAAAAMRFDPCLVVVAEYDDRTWPDFDAVFVNDSAVLTFVVDDGRRCGDGAPVLVAYASAVLSAAHLADPERVVMPVIDELQACLGADSQPSRVQVVPWKHAKPRRPDAQPFYLGDQGIGLCGDAWHAPARLESAYLSGRALGRALAATTSQ